MSESCGGDCKNCASKSDGCDSVVKKLPVNALSNIRRVIGVVSGKGGVGKSLSTAALAASMARKGYRVGVIDGDILGPSIPTIFGLKENLRGDGTYIYPAVTKSGIKTVSVNLMLDNPESPVIWRGSMLSNILHQFWTDVQWEDIDYLFIDMPPGTGDIPLTVYQSLPIDGVVIVSSPQSMVAMIVKKAFNMAEAMHVPVIGMVENFAYLDCPECGKRIYPFGEGKTETVAKALGIPFLAQLPFSRTLSEACDNGTLEELPIPEYDAAAETIDNYFG